MDRPLHILSGLLIMATCAGIAAWVAWRSLQKSDDPWKLIVKWAITGVAFGYGIVALAKIGVYGPAFGAAMGIILGVMWAPNIGAMVAGPFTALFDGGDSVDKVRPLYSMAQARRKAGKYREALAETRKQLDKFPFDFQGWMLLAEIQADDLKNIQEATRCIEEILNQPVHPPNSIAHALTRLADWHLSLSHNPDAARESFERIIQLFPETEFSNQAAQRIAHLASSTMLAEKDERPLLHVTHHEGYLGLQGKTASAKLKEEEPPEIANRLVKHLDEHPLDAVAREELALLYANFYQRLDLASEQLEQLINSAHQSQKHVVHWLNLLADLHIRVQNDKAGALASLQRVIELYPGSASASNAEKRIACIDLELKKNETSQAFQLGSYEQNIGLKGKVPRII